MKLQDYWCEFQKSYTIQWDPEWIIQFIWNKTFMANYYGRSNTQWNIFIDNKSINRFCVFSLDFVCNIYLRHSYWHHGSWFTKHSLQFFMDDFLFRFPCSPCWWSDCIDDYLAFGRCPVYVVFFFLRNPRHFLFVSSIKSSRIILQKIFVVSFLFIFISKVT